MFFKDRLVKEVIAQLRDDVVKLVADVSDRSVVIITLLEVG